MDRPSRWLLARNDGYVEVSSGPSTYILTLFCVAGLNQYYTGDNVFVQRHSTAILVNFQLAIR